MTGFEKMVNIISEAYISVYGVEKWNSLSNKEKHDVVMILAKDLEKALTA